MNLAIFTDIFFYALIVPVLPFALSAQAGVAEDQVQTWVSILLAVYSAALFIGSPASGIYADHTSSRRWPLLLGLVALTGATFLLAFGNSVGLFVLGRLLQGLSAAVVWSVGLALLVDTVGSSVGVALGYVSISMSIALLLAPIVGGALYNNVGYVSVYYVAFGVVGLDIVLRLLIIEKKIARQWIQAPETEDAQSDVEKSAQENPSAGEPHTSSTVPTDIGTGVTTIAPQANQPDDQSNDEEKDKKRNRLRPLIELLKSPRLLVALYGILVESGIL